MILSCGEALIDFVLVQDEGGSILYRPCPGGSPYNTAVALGRLGVPAGFCCGLSRDFFGSLLLSHLERSKVRTDWVSRIDRDTTLAFVSAESANAEVEYAFYCQDTADRSLKETDLPSSLPENVRLLQFGSVSLVLEPTASTMEQLMFRESSKRLVALDPNICSELIPERDTYCRRFESWLDHVDLLKASVTDLEWLYPEYSPLDAVRSMLKKWVQVVFLTSGPDGAWACTEKHLVFVEVERIRVLDTVGSGDIFYAGTLCRLWEEGRLSSGGLEGMTEQELRDCLSFAGHVAAKTCSRSGADSPWREELKN